MIKPLVGFFDKKRISSEPCGLNYFLSFLKPMDSLCQDMNSFKYNLMMDNQIELFKALYSKFSF